MCGTKCGVSAAETPPYYSNLHNDTVAGVFWLTVMAYCNDGLVHCWCSVHLCNVCLYFALFVRICQLADVRSQRQHTLLVVLDCSHGWPF